MSVLAPGVRDRSFKTVFRGYDRASVRAALDTAVKALEALEADVARLREQQADRVLDRVDVADEVVFGDEVEYLDHVAGRRPGGERHPRRADLDPVLEQQRDRPGGFLGRVTLVEPLEDVVVDRLER